MGFERYEGERYYLESLMEYLPEGVFILDILNLKILKCSAFAANMIGKSRKEIEGMSVHELIKQGVFFKEDGKRVEYFADLPLNRVIETKKAVLGERLRFQTREGLLTMSFEGAPIFDDQNNMIACVLSFANISTLIKNEADLNKIINELKNDIQHLEDINQKKSEAIAFAAHELKSPLASIILLTQTLSGSIPLSSEERENFFEKITAESKKLAQLITHTLEISRIESGKMEIKREPILISDILREIIVKDEYKNVKSIIKSDSNSLILADKELLKQIVINLLDNAIKYGCGEICKVNFYIFNDNSNVVCAVKDYGQGIQPEEQRHVFEKYFRGKNSHRDQGTGLGLAIVKSIIDAHNGKVWLESEPGKGSTFYFSLPAIH